MFCLYFTVIHILVTPGTMFHVALLSNGIVFFNQDKTWQTKKVRKFNQSFIHFFYHSWIIPSRLRWFYVFWTYYPIIHKCIHMNLYCIHNARIIISELTKSPTLLYASYEERICIKKGCLSTQVLICINLE